MVEKVSIKEVEPLIKSILNKNKGLTEEQLCLNLGYNGGYISQLRSRENSTGEPQVASKFYSQLKSYGLHYANYNKDEHSNIVSEPEVEYKRSPDIIAHTGTGQIVYVEAKDLTASYERLLEEKEARRKEAKQWAERAESEKDKYWSLIEKMLTGLVASSNKSKEQLENLRTEIIAEHGEMMATLDQIAGNEPGTTAAKAGILELAHRAQKTKRDKKAETGKQD